MSRGTELSCYNFFHIHYDTYLNWYNRWFFSHLCTYSRALASRYLGCPWSFLKFLIKKSTLWNYNFKKMNRTLGSAGLVKLLNSLNLAATAADGSNCWCSHDNYCDGGCRNLSRTASEILRPLIQRRHFQERVGECGDHAPSLLWMSNLLFLLSESTGTVFVCSETNNYWFPR